MKKIVVLIMILMGTAATAQDQNRPERSPEEMAQMQTKKMTLHLGLTESQEQKVYTLNLEAAKSRKQAMESRREAREERPSREQRQARREARMEKRIAFNRQLEAVLTPEQFARFLDNQNQQMDDRQEDRHERRGNRARRGRRDRN